MSVIATSTRRTAPALGRVAAALLVLVVLAALVFALVPNLDLWTAQAFFDWGGGFKHRTVLQWFLRDLGSYAPFVILAGILFGWGLRWTTVGLRARPSGRVAAFAALSFALGPGLVANVIFKDHSHRPRPIQTDVFGGSSPYRPFWRFDGACARNCSFVSGEGSAAAWTLGPAALVPAPWKVPALAGAAVFTVAVSALRMAFGGHYLSDVVFAALFTGLVLAGCWRLLLCRPEPPA